MQKGKFNVLVDAAWGSSGKGAAAARLADLFRVSDLSASNFPNAGHTVVMGPSTPGGFGLMGLEEKYLFKVLPSGAAIHRKSPLYKPSLWIGPNSGFWTDDLMREIRMVGYHNSDSSSLRIHPRAVVMHQRHRDAEAPNGKESTEHISSTMSGAGAAFTEKAMRKQNVTLARAFQECKSPDDFQDVFQSKLSEPWSSTFLHEVSQGYALSVNHGTHYPHCTFRDCTPQQAYADFLVKPNQVGDVYLNVRSRPIRVGNNHRDGEQVGYSGDFYPDQRELSWQEVGLMAEMPQDEIAQLAERERTTVTRKVRRVATQSWQLCKESARACGATKAILNFPQYIHWSAHGLRGGKEVIPRLHRRVREEIEMLENATNLKVVMIGSGARHEDYIWLE